MTQAQPAFHLLHPSQQQTQSRQPPPQSAAPFPHPGTLSSHSTQSLQPAQSQSQPNGNGAPWGGPFPALHLWPIHDTFVMKMIHLPDQQRIKIGRQTNTKTVPGERNAYFDSKVLSRTHAEIWEQGGKIYIKDMKSSNGTFINNERLSPEGVESDPFELKSEDLVEFGIDIVSEDNRTIVHHKVAAKVYCVFGAEDAALCARELVHYQSQDARGMRRLTGPSGPGGAGQGQGQGQGMNQLAQMGPVVLSVGGKPGGLSFDHVLHKLQTELARSKETGSELQTLATAMTDIQDTLGGGLPPSQNGSAGQSIPPQFRLTSAEAQAALASPHGQQAAAFISLQNQLSEMQTSLSGQLDKIRNLEGQLQEHESLKHELATMRDSMEESKREMDLYFAGPRGRRMTRGMDDDYDDDDDDARSIATMMDNDESEARMRDRRRGDRERERPRAPEPTMNGNGDDTQDFPREGIKENAELVTRIQTLSSEIAEAVQLSRSLQSQHGEAMSAVKVLTERVGELENGMGSRVAEAEQRWELWRGKFEEGWKKERETWEAERERLRGVVREWEEASRRAHEEEEERELNERLSEDDFIDEEEEEEEVEGGEEAEEGEMLTLANGWKEDVRPRKPRRRRPSHKASLAIRALKSAAGRMEEESGSVTPTAEDEVPRLRLRARKGFEEKERGLARSGSASTFKGGKEESSESGKESGDTLKDSLDEGENADATGKGGRVGRKSRDGTVIQPIPIFTVIIVAVAAGALYYRHKD